MALHEMVHEDPGRFVEYWRYRFIDRVLSLRIYFKLHPVRDEFYLAYFCEISGRTRPFNGTSEYQLLDHVKHVKPGGDPVKTPLFRESIDWEPEGRRR